MAKMLDRPVPEGSRSVSWPWYHHVLDKEMTPLARTMLEQYSHVAPQDVEKHVYSIVRIVSVCSWILTPGVHPRSPLVIYLFVAHGTVFFRSLQPVVHGSPRPCDG